MDKLKIIEDGRTKSRWLITEEGAKNGGFYRGPRPLLRFFSPLSPKVLKQDFKELFEKKGIMSKRSYDVVRNLTLDEYISISKALLKYNLRYNKKNNKLICFNSKL